MFSKCLVSIALLHSLVLVASVPDVAEVKLKALKDLRPPNCGASPVGYVTRVVGGEPAEEGAWPWMAALAYPNKSNPDVPSFLCGGSLISSKHILTAAHCIKTLMPNFVRLGVLKLDRAGDATPYDVDIEKMIMHPDYSSISKTNDVAVLMLKNEVPFTDLIHPICLPLDDPYKSDDYAGKDAIVAGWGATIYNGPLSDVLIQVALPVVNVTDCKDAYKTHTQLEINKSTICAGYEEGKKDACRGDSGGPLMYGVNRTYYEIGIVNYGYKCAEPGYPGVYARVTEFLDFINESMEKLQ